MPFTHHRRQQIHYTIAGNGPLIVLQHGFLGDGSTWHERGYVDALAEDFSVACVDSLGHGLSDKPADPDAFLALARQGAPELTAWVTEDVEPALAACYAQLYDIEGSRDAVTHLNVPVLLWDGQEDPYHDPMRRFAEEQGFQFLSTGGDHLGAVMDHMPEVTRTLAGFVRSAEAGGAP